VETAVKARPGLVLRDQPVIVRVAGEQVKPVGPLLGGQVREGAAQALVEIGVEPLVGKDMREGHGPDRSGLGVEQS
jgi:hypothetical protein